MAGIIARFRAGFTAYKQVMQATKEPSPIGELLHRNKVDPKKLGIAFGYHATPLDRVSDQIAQGKFDNINQDIYIGDKETAAHFGGRDENSVILLVAGGKDTRVEENENFGTNALCRGKDQEVFILEVNKINPEWLETQENPEKQIKLLERVSLAMEQAVAAFKN